MEKRYFGVHWTDKYRDNTFILLWDDGTWEEITVPKDIVRYGVKGKLDLRHCKHKKMTRTETMNWIEQKFKEMRET